MDNWKLYPAALKELGRVCKPLTGRAVLLTYDTKVMAHVRFIIFLKTWLQQFLCRCWVPTVSGRKNGYSGLMSEASKQQCIY